MRCSSWTTKISTAPAGGSKADVGSFSEVISSSERTSSVLCRNYEEMASPKGKRLVAAAL